jgi:predicted GNAT family acetyltransferase
MPSLRFVLTQDPEKFAKRAEQLLASRLECNVLATVLNSVLDGAHREAPPQFATGVNPDGEVAFAALRTPPFPLLVSPLDPVDADRLVELWLEVDPEIPGVSGVPDTASAIGAAWARRTGGEARRTFEEAMHVLTEVKDPPRPATGRLRLPNEDERDLLVAWMREFIAEARLVGAAQVETMVDARVRYGGLLLWEDGQPASLIGLNPPVAGVVRVGPVYTPPALRGRGYASSAVAAASRRALAQGAERCMLFTDLANPTSNKIYAEVGYRRCGDWEELAFKRGEA